MTAAVVVDASAGVEILTGTVRGRGLARLVPESAELWVPEHFYAEVLGVIRHHHLATRLLDRAAAETAVDRLCRWHLRQAGLPSLVPSAWAHRHNMSGADALYVALAQAIGASLLTDDHRLVAAPTFPREVPVLSMPAR